MPDPSPRRFLRYVNGQPRYYVAGVGDHDPEPEILELALMSMYPLMQSELYAPVWRGTGGART